MGEAQKERMEMWLMAEQKRDEAFLKHQERQAELSRQHELHMLQFMASLQNRGNYQPSHLVPTMHSNLPIGMHTQHPMQDIQHPNSEHQGWSVLHEQACPAASYHPPEISTSNIEQVYTNLDNTFS
jgi:hypothetical protein